MVSNEFNEAITETLDILNHMENVYIEKIPKKFIDFLKNNQSTTYISDLDHSKKLNEMNLNEKTKDILATIYINYWCTLEQKSDYISLLEQNEKKYQKELREKYNPDDLFKKHIEDKNVTEYDIQSEVTLVKYKESIFKRFINKIKDIFHIK